MAVLKLKIFEDLKDLVEIVSETSDGRLRK